MWIFSLIKCCRVNKLFVIIELKRENDVKNLNLENITYKMSLSKIIASSSMEKTFMTNPLILM